MRGGILGLTFVAMTGYFVTAAATLFFALTSHIVFGVIFAALAAYGLNIMSTSTQALLQLAVDDHYRGRIMSLYLLLYRGTPAIGAMATGFIAEYVGLQASFAIAGGLCTLLFLALVPSYRTIVEAIEKRAPKS